ncbi:hypothetical protein OF83DRAFT_112785 [Amylostereum chailletii]|nr:hypothetical protein OF83DRAFT_112785 [Amylostereum chailletii]
MTTDTNKDARSTIEHEEEGWRGGQEKREYVTSYAYKQQKMKRLSSARVGMISMLTPPRPLRSQTLARRRPRPSGHIRAHPACTSARPRTSAHHPAAPPPRVSRHTAHPPAHPHPHPHPHPRTGTAHHARPRAHHPAHHWVHPATHHRIDGPDLEHARVQVRKCLWVECRSH